jgi:linoleoyl-CoA desaturase
MRSGPGISHDRAGFTLNRTGEQVRATAKYQPHTELRAELNRQVGAYLAGARIAPDGGVRIWLKSAIVLSWFALSYVFLVWVATSWWQAALGALSLSLAVAGIGFNVQHDGGHRSFSRSRTINRIAAWALDLVGASSYIWNYKHNQLHHHHTNVGGIDGDLEAGPLLRLAPHQKHHRVHRFQHWYIWLLYGFVPPKWQFFDDLKDWITGRVEGQPMRRPWGRELALFLGGKLLFVTWAFAVPLLFHPLWEVLALYALCSLLTGITLSSVFVLAHCVDETHFCEAPRHPERMAREFVEHQLATTANFATDNRWLTWYLGGLNFQVEHHLFPRVSHVHYPALAPIVSSVARQFGAPYLHHATLGDALASHVRFLKRMGLGARLDDRAGA